MVAWTAEQKREYERGIREDYLEFLEAHKAEAKGQRWKYVQARLLTLTGDSLRDLEKRKLIESDGYYAYRPL